MKNFLIAITLALVGTYGVFAASQGVQTKNQVTCKICKDLVQLVDDAVQSNSTLEDIQGVLNGFCDILTGLEESCKDFVAEQLPIVIDLLVEEYLNPEEVCFNLYLCP